MLPSLFVTLVRAASRRLGPVRDFALDQRRLLRNDVLAVKGLMPLLAWWLDRRTRGRDHRSGAARRPVP